MKQMLILRSRATKTLNRGLSEIIILAADTAPLAMYVMVCLSAYSDIVTDSYTRLLHLPLLCTYSMFISSLNAEQIISKINLRNFLIYALSHELVMLPRYGTLANIC